MKTFKIHKSDYTKSRYNTVLNYLILAKKAGEIDSYEAFENYSIITASDSVYNDIQELINN